MAIPKFKLYDYIIYFFSSDPEKYDDEETKLEKAQKASEMARRAVAIQKELDLIFRSGTPSEDLIRKDRHLDKAWIRFESERESDYADRDTCKKLLQEFLNVLFTQEAAVGRKKTGGVKRQFTTEQILEIRQAQKEGFSLREVSEEFKCSRETIRQIWNGTLYKDVKPPLRTS